MLLQGGGNKTVYGVGIGELGCEDITEPAIRIQIDSGRKEFTYIAPFDGIATVYSESPAGANECFVTIGNAGRDFLYISRNNELNVCVSARFKKGDSVDARFYGTENVFLFRRVLPN